MELRLYEASSCRRKWGDEMAESGGVSSEGLAASLPGHWFWGRLLAKGFNEELTES